MVICNSCNIDKNIDEFYKKINCKKCFNEKRKCIHDKLKSKCRECGGSEICIHDKIKPECRECI